jgi:hypothetical protein
VWVQLLERREEGDNHRCPALDTAAGSLTAEPSTTGDEVPGFNLASCLGRLVEQNPGRTEAHIQADVREVLLSGGFDLSEEHVRLESPAPIVDASTSRSARSSSSASGISSLGASSRTPSAKAPSLSGPMAERFGIGKDTGTRICKNQNLKPWAAQTFNISADPNFDEKLVDVVGRYLHPSERATVFSFDEKTLVQVSIAPSRPCP